DGGPALRRESSAHRRGHSPGCGERTAGRSENSKYSGNTLEGHQSLAGGAERGPGGAEGLQPSPRSCDGVSTHCRRAGDTAWVPRCSVGRTAGSAGPRRRNAQLLWAMRGQDPRLTLAEPYYSGNLNSRSSTFSNACLTSPCTSSRESARRTSSRFAWVVGFGGVKSRQQSWSGSIDVS